MALDQHNFREYCTVAGIDFLQHSRGMFDRLANKRDNPIEVETPSPYAYSCVCIYVGNWKLKQVVLGFTLAIAMLAANYTRE
jgi:hypothetical protein